MRGASIIAKHQRRSAFDAAVILIIGMGFGRFAFTAVYPHMVDEGLLSLGEGSWAASANYAGYLLGAILGIRVQAHNAHRLCLAATAGTVLCLGLLGGLDSSSIVIAVRGVAGIFSSLAMVSASLWLLEHRRHARGAPMLFGGVGIGIALSAELLVLGSRAGLHSHGLWLLLAVVSLLLALSAVPGLTAEGTDTLASTSGDATAKSTIGAWPLTVIYGLAGYGYIVTATYLPLLVKTALPDVNPAHVWAVFGLGAAPSCLLWHGVDNRMGTRKSLLVNLMVQAIGVALPVVVPNAAGYLISALLVGATFMGTVTIAMPAGQRLAKASGSNLMAKMTVVYSIGQIAGPLVANGFYARTHSFSWSLITAAFALACGALISVTVPKS
jgi:MFS family permease